MGVRRWLGDATSDRVTVIPKFINTPIDVLAINLFDLIAPLAFKVAAIDGKITDDERICIQNYFINEWGYDPAFIVDGIAVIDKGLESFSIQDLAKTFAEFSKANPDCNYQKMTKDLVVFIKQVIEADGVIDEREELALEKIELIFVDAGRTFSKENFQKVSNSMAESVKRSSESVLQSNTVTNTKAGIDMVRSAAVTGASGTFKAGKNLIGKILK